LTTGQVLEALGLPASARVDQRVPKKLLIENGAPTTADKKQINDGIESLNWIAALKPSTIGVPDFRDETREYLEIAVLTLHLRASSKAPRLVELVHRAIPYPVVLLIEHSEGSSLTLTHKRWAQNEAGKTVLDGEFTTAKLDAADELAKPFLTSMNLLNQPKANLYDLYQGWINTAIALQAAAITGSFRSATTPTQAIERAEALRAASQLESRIAALRATAAKEKQIPKQVQLNLEIKRLKAELTTAQNQL
jgi:hypothetical protein